MQYQTVSLINLLTLNYDEYVKEHGEPKIKIISETQKVDVSTITVSTYNHSWNNDS